MSEVEKIMQICRAHKSCVGCPFDGGYSCDIAYKPPQEWDKEKIEYVTNRYGRYINGI